MNKLLSLALASIVAAGWTAAASAGSHSAPTMGFAQMKLARADNVGVDQRHGRGTDDGLTQKMKGADDPAGDNRRGRHLDDITVKRNGADDPAGDNRRGRHLDDVTVKRNGADDPAGDDRRGRRIDDGPNHR